MKARSQPVHTCAAACGFQTLFTDFTFMSYSFNGIAPIEHLGVLLATGEESRKFLHTQLTHDVMLLKHDRARLSAFLSAKGRMQASFIALRHGENDVLLLVDKTILASVQKRLGMFIFRAKTKLVDVSDQWQILGLAGSAVPNAADHAAWSVQRNADDTSIIHLYPAADAPRALWLAPAGATAPGAISLSAEDWLWSEAESGVATLSAPVVEAFVPQMINYESLDGVNFKKGCYPGQEVVSRSQFRSVIKRRAYLAHGQLAEGQTVNAGDDVFLTSEQGPDSQPCGLVVQAALTPATHADKPDARTFTAIISIQTSAADEPLQIRKPAGQDTQYSVDIALSAMPYPILEKI